MSATGFATNIRRLPGLRFEAQSPPLADALPRMDVAVFIGFAASGPINRPVAIEDSAQFAEIFGEDAALAWNAERGLITRAYLGPTVRDFFRQGGRRCWIIRVARDAHYNYFPIPALLEVQANGEFAPAFARARSEGSWSDALRAGTRLEARPIEITRASFADNEFELSPSSPGDVRPGDLLRFNLRDEGYGLFAVVESVQPVDEVVTSPPAEEIATARRRRIGSRRSVAVQCVRPIWFSAHWLDGLSRRRVSPVATVNEDGSVGPVIADVFHWTFSDQGRSVTLEFLPAALPPQAGARLSIDYFDAQLLLTVQLPENQAAESPLQETVQVVARVDRWLLPRPSQVLIFKNRIEGQAIEVAEPLTVEGPDIKLECLLSLTDAPPPGTVMRVECQHKQLWLTVRDISSITDASELSPKGTVQIEGRGFWQRAVPPAISPETTVEVERLSFDLLVRETGDNPRSLSDLGFHESHSRYWGAWPTDEQRYQNMSTIAFTANAKTNREVFPLAAQHPDMTNQNSSREIYLPLAMPLLPDSFPGAIDQPQSALERDGLAVFGSDLFLDPQMTGANVENLISQADYLRYQSPTPRALAGIHAALDIEEATIIAVPDSLQRGWTFKPLEAARPEPPAATDPASENFLDCGLRDLVAPRLESESETPGGTISLRWSAVKRAARYIVEESRDASWSGAEVVYSGSQTRLVIYSRSEGDYFYRVRAETAAATSNWSEGIRVSASSVRQWEIETAETYRADPLLDVHRALLRMCAARGDLFAILALPDHYREDDAINHTDLLRPAKKPFSSVQPSGRLVAPLSFGEARATSYGAVYHPWLISRRDDLLEPWHIVPPDGAACGVMAQRAITRGAWTAPANELLRGVIALTPPLAAWRRLDFQEAQINVFRREPRGFLSLGADTLSHEIDLRPINVRRLLILLRRLALRLGATYVFEPNDDSFRRLVQRGFEAALEEMFERGAFAGNTAANSYRVVTDDSINTPASVDQGRFIVELRVAPSLPLTFITIRMVQTNDRSLVMEVR